MRAAAAARCAVGEHAAALSNATTEEQHAAVQLAQYSTVAAASGNWNGRSDYMHSLSGVLRGRYSGLGAIAMDEIRDAVDRFFLHDPAAGITGPHYDAVETIDELARSDPDAAWPVIEMLIDKAPTEEALAYLAAGPLENLLRKHGLAVAKTIRAAAEQKANVRAALSHVWLLPNNDEVHQQLGEWLSAE